MEKRRINFVGIIAACWCFALTAEPLTTAISYAAYGMPKTYVIVNLAHVCLLLLLGISVFFYKNPIVFAVVCSVLAAFHVIIVLPSLAIAEILFAGLVAVKWLTLAALAIGANYEMFKGAQKVICYLWFVPAVLDAGILMIEAIGFFAADASSLYAGLLIWSFCQLLCTLLLGAWAVKPFTSVRYVETGNNSLSEAKMEMVAHVLLLIFTCGIYNYVWVYRVTKGTNCIPGDEYRDPLAKTFLCMLVPFYYNYWIYQSSKRIDRACQMRGIPSDTAVLNTILGFFIGIVPPIIMQDKINTLC